MSISFELTIPSSFRLYSGRGGGPCFKGAGAALCGISLYAVKGTPRCGPRRASEQYIERCGLFEGPQTLRRTSRDKAFSNVTGGSLPWISGVERLGR